MITNTRISLLIGGLIVLVGLAACGAAPPEPVSVTLEMTEFAFTPDTITAQPGAQVSVTLENMGGLEHNFLVMEEGYIAEEPYTEEDEANTYFASGEIQAGESSTVTFTAPDTPGTYQFICNIPAHLGAGMVGTLTVTE